MIKQNLIITYSNQKARQIKKTLSNPFDKVVTLDNFIKDFYDKYSFKNLVDPIIAKSYIYKIIKNENIKYLSFISSNSDLLDLIYEFILKVNASKINIDLILSGEKLDAIKTLIDKYAIFKKEFNLVDYNDVVQFVIDNFDKYDFSDYDEVYIDDFDKEGIKFYKSNIEYDLIALITLKAKRFEATAIDSLSANLFKLSKQPFDIIDEINCSLKLVRKILEEDKNVSSDDICIVTTDINEYASIFRLYLKSYDLKGYDSKGYSLNLFNKKSKNAQVINKFAEIEKKLNKIDKDSKKFNVFVDLENIREKLIKESYILEDKIGIELTEANQLVGLNKTYKHIIFIGADINHFPPKRSDNFLYTSEIGLKYFCENNYYESSLLQYNELKKRSDNLYVIYPKYKEKRELAPSIIIDKNIPNIIDISDINSKKNKIDNQEYLDSIASVEFTKYDGLDVNNIEVKHLSASQLGSYSKCPLKYLYNYKLNIKTPVNEDEGFDVMQQGSLMHSCFESFSKEIKGNENLDLKDLKTIMIQVLESEYVKFLNDSRNDINEENIYHKIYKKTLSKNLDNENEDGILNKFVIDYYNNKEDVNYFTNSEFEKEFALDIDLKPYVIKNENDKEYFIKGFIDRIDNLKDRVNIIDYKSKKADNVLQDKLNEIREFKDFQLALYTIYAYYKYEKDVDSYLLTFKTDKNISTKFARISTNEEWIKASRGKDTGVLFDEKFYHELIDNVFKIKEKIEQGDFRFDKSNEEYCGYCEIKHMCNKDFLNKGI